MSRSSMTFSSATWMRSARSGSSLMATMPRCALGTSPKWMVSGSPSVRPCATFTGSTSPIRSPTEVSGVASFSAYRSERCRHATGRSSPSSAARRRDSGVIGSSGCSPSSEPSITGVHSSSRPTMVRSSRVLPWPRSPSSTTSWPASSARSSCGSTVLSNPTMPGHGFAPLTQRGQQVVADLGLHAARDGTPPRAARPRCAGGSLVGLVQRLSRLQRYGRSADQSTWSRLQLACSAGTRTCGGSAAGATRRRRTARYPRHSRRTTRCSR